MVLLMDQSRTVGEEEKGSKQFFMSPSMTVWGHFSSLASWIAQRMAAASTLKGGACRNSSCPNLLDFTSVVSNNNSNCPDILSCGSISVKLYAAKGRWMPLARGNNIVALRCVPNGAY